MTFNTPLLAEQEEGQLTEGRNLGRDVIGVTTPEHEWLEHGPDFVMCPMLRKNISRIFITVDVIELEYVGCNGFTDTVIG